MGSFSDYLENALLNHVFGTGSGHKLSYAPTNKWLALCTVAVAETSEGADLTEPAEAAGYHRVQCETWLVASTGFTQNSGDITFVTATEGWGKILDFAICDTDAYGAGEVLAYGTLTVSKSVQTGDTPKFAAGDLDITLT